MESLSFKGFGLQSFRDHRIPNTPNTERTVEDV